MNQKTKDILKAVAVIVFVPTAITVTYLGAKATFNFYNKKKSEGNVKKILDELQKGIDKKNAEGKSPIPIEKSQKTLTDWDAELKKMSPSGLSLFTDWFMLTVPYGRNKQGNYWAYEDINADEFAKKKDALVKYTTSENLDGKLITLYDKTRILDYLYEIEKVI